MTQKQLEQLDQDLVEAQEKHHVALNSISAEGLSFEEWQKLMSVTHDRLEELDTKKRMSMAPTFRPYGGNGTLMSLQEFIESVKSGGFIDYDGSGSYMKDGQETDIRIHPSDVENGNIRKDFTEIAWYNK